MGVGVVNVGDSNIRSGLLVDNFTAVPEPGAVVLLGLGLAGVGLARLGSRSASGR